MGARMLVFSDVSKWYFGQTRVLDKVNFELKKGDFLYVVGGSGAGKSTLLRLMTTEESPSKGSVSIFGYDIASASPSTLRAIRRSLGYVPQDVKLIPDLTVLDNVALSLSLAGHRVLNAQSKAKISELLHRLGLEPKRDKLAGTLSGGEAQRVAVARALVRSPELVVADEPTGSQDRDYTWSLMDLFLKANVKGTAIVLATHDREIVRRLRKRCAVLKGGHISIEEALCMY
jgi:cell division transport system ATP-binding protein